VIYWSECLATDPEVRIQFPEPPDFLGSGGSGTKPYNIDPFQHVAAFVLLQESSLEFLF
jgi:hypothetical protein